MQNQHKLRHKKIQKTRIIETKNKQKEVTKRKNNKT